MRRFIALFAVLAPLVTSAAVTGAIAGHDLSESWGHYQTACALVKAQVARIKIGLSGYDSAAGEYYDCLRKFDLRRSTGETVTGSPKKYCDIEFANLQWTKQFLKVNRAELQDAVKLCDKARQNYSAHLSEHMTEWLLTGVKPDPNVAAPSRRKPPTRRRRPPVRKTYRPPPERGHSTAQTQALAIIGGIIIQGVRKGSRSGTRRSHPSSRPGYIP